MGVFDLVGLIFKFLLALCIVALLLCFARVVWLGAKLVGLLTWYAIEALALWIKRGILTFRDDARYFENLRRHQ